MRTRGTLLFLAGVVTGALLFYSVAWRTGALVPGNWLTRTTREFETSAPTPNAPLKPIPFPTATPGSRAAAIENPLPLAPPTPGEAAASSGSIVSNPLPLPSLAPLLLPVRGIHAAALKDNFEEARDGARRHEAIDILAPRGTPVIAAVDGTVAKLFTSQAGGLTVYEFDPMKTFSYYYAHLDRYAPGLAEGQALKRGDPIGEVGTTGNAPKNTPHLHFAIFRLGPEKHWWQGEPVNPYPLLLKAEER
ncbi:MAG TPA: M23 family metallopeptidase [Thermoanaerobaculia bacterium]|nr:M23 family metallopeptidase [Thermoanaerobaculia bacterium]